VVVDPEVALRDEHVIYPDVGTNVVQRVSSGSRADFAGCDVVVEERIVNQRLTAAPIEPRSAAAYWTDDGRLVHYAACQGAHPARDVLATVYGLDPSHVRVVVPDVGGGFGAKSRIFPDEAALGFYAQVVRRPVRWTESRSENMVAMAHGRGQVQHARLGGTRDGRITAYQLDVVQDAGAYPVLGARLPAMTMLMTTGAYDIANAGFSGVSVVTNTMSTTAYRGAGRPEAAVAIERMVDRFAAEIGMDPADVRRRNLVAPFDDRYTTAIGTVYDVGDYPAALERVLRAADYDALRAEQARRREAGDPVALGIGIASYVEITAAAGGGEFGAVELDAGRIRVRSGSTPTGQGHDTTWAMIVADRTGVALEDVEVIHGDTQEIPRGGLTVGSRSVQLGGAAIASACDTLVELGRDAAADQLEASVDDVVFDREAARFHVTGAPAKGVGWAELAAAVGAGLAAEADHLPEMPTFPFGAHVAVVEVDTETGRADLRRIVAVDDAGRIINPVVAEGQVHGGIAQGAAQALLEAVRYDGEGQPLTTNFADYPVISAAELPSVELVPMATPTFVNELGAKGIGESGTIGAIPAVYNAVVDALGHLGIRHLETPVTPERVWAALAAR
jgi:carbon-monoxide dehydrogenase large subunit